MLKGQRVSTGNQVETFMKPYIYTKSIAFFLCQFKIQLSVGPFNLHVLVSHQCRITLKPILSQSSLLRVYIYTYIYLFLLLLHASSASYCDAVLSKPHWIVLYVKYVKQMNLPCLKQQKRSKSGHFHFIFKTQSLNVA